MSYSDQIVLVKYAIIDYCRDCITENWSDVFDMWLIHEADMDLGHGYQNKFKEQFADHINEKTEEKLWLAGKHLVFAISAFKKYKENTDLESILDFTEIFIKEQMDDFDNWCDDNDPS